VDRLTRRESEDSCGCLWPSKVTMPEMDWAARRAEFAEMVQNGDFSHLKAPKIQPNGMFSIQASRHTGT
jgi:hypothetical protein